MDLEHHKEQYGHWSDDEYESDDEDGYDTEDYEDWGDDNGNLAYPDCRYTDEEETEFGPDKEDMEMLL